MYSIFTDHHNTTAKIGKPIDLEIGIPGLFIYSIVSLVLITTWVHSWFTKRKLKRVKIDKVGVQVRRFFRIFLSIFLAARIIWLCFRTWEGDDVTTFVLNRLAILTYLTAFTLVIFHWAESFHKNYYDSSSFLPKLGGVFVLLNGIVYILEIAMIIFWILSDETREGNPVYEANIIVDVGLSLCMSIGFLVYGCLTFIRFCKSDDSAIEDKKKELFKILIITIAFTACFFCRVVMFVYRPLTGKMLPVHLFWTLAYYLPESLPSFCQIYLTRSSQEQVDRAAEYIENLYKAEDEDDDSHNSSPYTSNSHFDSNPLLTR